MMRKENILLFVLISAAVLGVGLFLKSNSAMQEKAPAQAIQANGSQSAQVRVTNNTGIDWQDYSKGLSLAKSQGKHIFLYFYADW
ncbi:MAG: hypothetical protein ABIJ31_08045 [Pseudomonadota bacterium]